MESKLLNCIYERELQKKKAQKIINKSEVYYNFPFIHEKNNSNSEEEKIRFKKQHSSYEKEEINKNVGLKSETIKKEKSSNPYHIGTSLGKITLDDFSYWYHSNQNI